MMRDPLREPVPERHEPIPERREPVERPEFRVVPRSTREIAEEGDVIRWGPVLGGVVASIGIMLVLTVLGVALGLAQVATGGVITAVNATNWAIWTAVSMIVALFFGGWLAARTSVFGGVFPGIVNASVVWASVLAATLFLAGLGVSAALGPIAGIFPTTVTPGGATAAAVTAGAVWAFIGIVISYGAAIAGGYWGGLWHTMHTVPPPRPER